MVPVTERGSRWSGVIGPHGGYRNLQSYRTAEIVHDATMVFCSRFVDRRSRTHDQMVQAARSGKQNIAERAACHDVARHPMGRRPPLTWRSKAAWRPGRRARPNSNW